MSLIFMDGFDNYDEAVAGIRPRWELGYRERPLFAAGRFGGRAVQRPTIRSDGNIQVSVLPSAELFFGVAVKSVTLPITSDRLAYITSTIDSTILGEVTLLASGAVRLDINGLTATSGVSVITANTWHYVELRLKADPTTGVFEIRIDEVVKATISGDTGSDDINRCGISGPHGEDGGDVPPVVYFDDVYVADTAVGTGTGWTSTYAGSIRVDTLANTGAVTPVLEVGKVANGGVPGTVVTPPDPLIQYISGFSSEDMSDIGLGAATIVGLCSTAVSKQLYISSPQNAQSIVCRITDNLGALRFAAASCSTDDGIIGKMAEGHVNTNPTTDVKWVAADIVTLGTELQQNV